MGRQEASKQQLGFRVHDRLQGTTSLVIAGPSVQREIEQAETASPDVLQCPTLKHKLVSRPSPFAKHNYFGGGFVSDDDKVYLDSLVHAVGSACKDEIENTEALERLGTHEVEFAAIPQFAIRAGPRETIYHSPELVQIAIVCTGTLCPGINDIIRSIVSKALDYGVPEGNIRGIPFGFKGFSNHKHVIKLTRHNTDAAHLEGGCMLGTSSTNGTDVKQIVKWLDLWSIDMLFVIGGTPGLGVAAEVQRECAQSNVDCCVIAIPKSIDNHILLVDRSFGFDTAVEEAQKALMAAKVEASSAYRGIGLVKLMGRQSGFIAVKAALAFGQVDVCLIPEINFKLPKLLEYLEEVLDKRGHAVICMSEGAGLDLIPEDDTSSKCEGGWQDEDDHHDGRPGPAYRDAGNWLKGQLKKQLGDVDVKYIDGGPLLRGTVPTSNDRIYCKMLAHGAVHAAFAGFTGTMIGMVNTHYCFLPLAAGQVVRTVDARGSLWSRLRATTGQPNLA